MEERKKPESRNAGAHERRAEGRMTDIEKEREEMRRADIAGEVYDKPVYTKGPPAQGKKGREVSEKQKGGEKGR